MDFEVAMTEPCPRCGTRDEEWRDPQTKRPYPDPPYVAEARRCLGCVELAEAQEAHSHRKTGRMPPGYSLHLRRYSPDLDARPAEWDGSE